MAVQQAHPRFPAGRNAATAIIAFAACALFMLPLVAMQFTNEVDWTGADFAVWFVLLSVTGAALVWIIRKTPPRKWLGRAALVIALFLYVWAELAVGIFTNLGR